MSQVRAANKNLDLEIKSWQQGDCVLGNHSFVFEFDSENPATQATKDLDADSGEQFAVEQVLGLVILTQTCDLIRSVSERPYVEVAPLVKVADSLLGEVCSRKRPSYAEVPSLTNQNLVADLDRVMTIEKPVLLKWKKIRGCNSTQEQRMFAEALARKRARPALPDDFVGFLNKFQDRCVKNSKRKDQNGNGLMDVFKEIRVQPSPEWSGGNIKVRFWFLVHRNCTLGDKNAADKLAESLIEILKKEQSRFEIDYLTAYYSEMTAEEYIFSDRLDYDRLTKSIP